MKYDIPLSTIDRIAKKAKQVFNVKRIKTRHEYMLLSSKDSIGSPEYFIYENSPIEYIVFNLKEPLHVYKGKNKIERKLLSFFTEIETSLWNAITDKGGNPILAIELSEVYQWTIDFFGIQKGDYFKVIYTEDFVEGKSVGNIKPVTAYFNHMGNIYYAFPYPDSVAKKIKYYDENGKNLQKSFLKTPLKYSRISSRFFPFSLSSRVEKIQTPSWCRLCCSYRDTRFFGSKWKSD